MTRPQLSPTLIGDRIENPLNVAALHDVATAFGTSLRLTGAVDGEDDPGVNVADYRPCIAFDNVPGATDLFGYAVPRTSLAGSALVVGNERRGISRGVLRAADRMLCLPMTSGPGVASLNVAAAAAVGLWYVRGPVSGPMATRRHHERHRPDVLLLGATDHAELGSAIRSAAALGWRHLLVDDRHGVWFDTPRAQRTEGRAAARWHRNAIRLTRAAPDERLDRPRAVVVTPHPMSADSVPLRRVKLAQADQLMVIADPGGLETDAQFDRLAFDVRFAHLDLPVPDAACRYRMLATLALAETARQVGRPEQTRRPAEQSEPDEPRRRRGNGRWRPSTYDHAIAMTTAVRARVDDVDDVEDFVLPDELSDY